MGLPRFFDRVYTAAGKSLSITRPDLERLLGERTVAIRLGPRCRERDNPKWIAELLANMLSRFYPVLVLSGDDRTLAAVSEIARSINPSIELREGDRGDVTVGVGLTGNDCEDVVAPAASGWVAMLSFTGSADPDGPANPYSAAVAAALAASEIFRRMFHGYLPEPYRRPGSDYALSLLDHGTSTGADLALAPDALGQVVLGGVGAVANPALWVLARHQNLEGEMWLVDPERIDLDNLERYALATDRDVEKRTLKVDLGVRELARSRVTAHAKPVPLDVFAGTFGDGFPFPTLCVSPDNIDARRQAQSLLPRLLVNGATGEGNIGVSWHRFDSSRPCLCCVYHPGDPPKSDTQKVAEALGLDHDKAAKLWAANKAIGKEDFDKVAAELGLTDGQQAEWRGRSIREFYTGFVCGAVRMELPAAKKAASVPLAHQSVLTGALMAAELIKRTSPSLEALSQPASAFQCYDVRAPLGTQWISAGISEPVRDCICQDPDYRAVYEEKWGSRPDGG